MKLKQGPFVRGPNSTNPRIIKIQVPQFLCSRAFFRSFSLFFLEHSIIKLDTKWIKLNFLLKVSDLRSNFTLTLDYLNPALNNLALINNRQNLNILRGLLWALKLELFLLKCWRHASNHQPLNWILRRTSCHRKKNYEHEHYELHLTISVLTIGWTNRNFIVLYN